MGDMESGGWEQARWYMAEGGGFWIGPMSKVRQKLPPALPFICYFLTCGAVARVLCWEAKMVSTSTGQNAWFVPLAAQWADGMPVLPSGLPGLSFFYPHPCPYLAHTAVLCRRRLPLTFM